MVGNLLVAGAVLCEASFVLLGKRLAPPYQPLRLALGANVVGLVLSLPLAAAALPTLRHRRGAARRCGCSATWYSLSSSVFCLWLWYRGLPYVETWLAGLATAAIPVAALATSALYLGEPIGGWRLAGAALVIAAIVLGRTGVRQGRRPLVQALELCPLVTAKGDAPRRLTQLASRNTTHALARARHTAQSTASRWSRWRTPAATS